MYAINRLTRKLVNLVSENDALLVRDYPGIRWQYAAPVGGITNSTTPVTLKAAEAGKRNYVASAHMSATQGTGDHVLIVKSGSTVLMRANVDMGANGDRGGQVQFPLGLEGGVNEAITIEMGAADAGTVYVNAMGYTA